MVKTKKRRKRSRMRGRKTCGYSTKMHKGKGSRGGVGMAGTVKKSGHRKTTILRMGIYFGKKGITSRASAVKKNKVINLKDLMKNLDGYKKGHEVDLTGYKLLGEGEIKEKLKIKCDGASESAIEKVEKAGGEIIFKNKEKEETKK